MRHDLTESPAALAGVTVGVNYSIQNLSGLVVYWQAADTAPTDPGDANRIGISGLAAQAVVSASVGESIYVWAPGAVGRIIVNEA